MLEASVTDQLVIRARDGDVDAFESLARDNAVTVYRIAFRIVRNPQDAQDVAQRALLSAWQGLGTFRGDSSFATWLHQIVRRHALNRATRAHHDAPLGPDLDPTDAHLGPAQLVEADEISASVRAAVAALPGRQANVVRLYHFEHLTYAEIAAATRSSEPAVRSQLFRARRSLASALIDQR